MWIVCVCVCFYTHFLVAWRWFPIWTRRTEKRRRKEEEEKVKGMRAVFNFQKLSISPHLGLSVSLFLSSTPLEMKRERERRSFRVNWSMSNSNSSSRKREKRRRRRGGGGERWTAFTFRRCASKWRRRRRDGREECSVRRPPTHSNTDDSISY